MLVAPGATAAAGSDATAAGRPTLDDAWFASVARAESLMSAASCCGQIDSTDRAAVAEQIRLGVHVLGSVVFASIAADTVIAGPLAVARPPEPPAHGWTHTILGATGGISGVAGLAHLLATLSGASPLTNRVLALVGGSAAAIGGVFNHWRPPARPATDTIERMRALDLETDLRESVGETERDAEPLLVDLRGMALDSCATETQVTSLARRYANALQGVSAILDCQVARSAAIARSCAEYPGLAAESRERCEALASHLDTLGAVWEERRWLVERAKRNALDYLIRAGRP